MSQPDDPLTSAVQQLVNVLKRLGAEQLDHAEAILSMAGVLQAVIAKSKGGKK